MNEVVLPDDILHEIFRQINGWSVTQCRAVCRRWRDAVDSLTNHDWEKICQNDAFNNEYVTIQKKSGLPWRDVFRVTASWSRINSAVMKTSLLCEGVELFKVLPGGIVACLQKTKSPTAAGNYCDTIVYYNTEGHQCDKQQFDFNFDATLYDENEHLQVFVLKDKRLCIIVKKTKKKYFVGSVSKWDHRAELTLIGKEVYFKNKTDDVIYCSRLTDKNTLKTKCLEAFERNFDNFNAETIIAFAMKDGELYFLCDEGSTWRANIYHHKNADFGCADQIEFDYPYLLTELADFGFDWKSKPLFTYLCNHNQATIFKKNAFFSQGLAMLMSRSNTKTIEIHYVYIIYAIEHLMLLLKKKPKRKIVLKDVLPNENEKVIQLDIVETLTSHKILALIGKNLYVFDFSHDSDNINTTDSSTSRSPGNSTTKPIKAEKTKILPPAKILKKKAVVAKKKGIKKVKVAAALGGKHAYATRSSTKL